jgi:acetyl-CoA carboxylase biotin carboxyl carrier protein
LQFDLESVRQLLHLFDASSAMELKLEIGEQRLHLSRGQSAHGLPYVPPVQGVAPVPVPVVANHAMSELSAVADVHMVRSPIVGTFYRSPSPEAPSFVEIGGRVEVGQVVCIIEAMKLMNEITSEVSGTVRSLLVQNGDPVEFGQPLFEVV